MLRTYHYQEQRQVMVHFKDYKSPSSKNKYLLIEADDGIILSKLLTHNSMIPNQCQLSIESTFLCLGNQILLGDIRWGGVMPRNVQILANHCQSKPQDSSESIVGPDSGELLLPSKEVTSSLMHLELVLRERDGISKEISTSCKSLEKSRKKVKKLKSYHDTAKKEVKEVKSKVSTTEKEFHKCSDISLAIENA
ncbi:hypothetical protein CQW23_01931 [Capsicum baccatum]|uniref:Uncharacterized protein n=1 Tax=Capsicum baccatum TaxID=33114 RepID=A0A2G2XQ04_CAPBA|nr:hypothetical protein CQW23_01931 [Capsicum baccatum]